MSTSSKSKLSILELVYSPLSSQEATWIKRAPEVEQQLRQSDFYMIGARAEIKFSDFSHDEVDASVTFTVGIGDRLKDSVTLKMRELPNVVAQSAHTLAIEAGDKIVQVRSGSLSEPGSEILEQFTTESLLMARSRGRAGIYGLSAVREFATYDLLYVGIAKVGDSYERLIAKAHEARMEILSNEPQRHPGARVTDEIYLFLFKIEPIIVQTFSDGHDFADSDLSGEWDRKRFVADAEKAFVSLLKPHYNITKFVNYPKGDDGLYNSDFDRYGYAIGEILSFNTAHGRIRGGRDPNTDFITNEADCIFVEGDAVKLYVSGVDFPDSRLSGTNSGPSPCDLGPTGLAQGSENRAPRPTGTNQAPEPES